MRFQRFFPYVFLLFVLSVSACQGLFPSSSSAPSGSVLYQDDFSSSTTGWDRLASDEGVMDYDGGGYRILVNALQVSSGPLRTKVCPMCAWKWTWANWPAG